MTGEVIVAGLVTGTHIIEDIGISVPHKVAVHIPAELALRSKDLYRALQQRWIFQLEGGSGLSAIAPSAQATQIRSLAAELAAEKQLRQEVSDELAEEKRRSDDLRKELAAEKKRSEGLEGLQAQLHGLQAAIGRLGDGPRVLHTRESAAAPDVVGGEAPTFLPERIRPETVESQIRSTTETAEKTNVSSAASKLRELKRQPNG